MPSDSITELTGTLCRTLNRRARCAACACTAASLLNSAQLNIVVCGSGPGAQTAAALLAAQGHRVFIYMSPNPRYAARTEALKQGVEANGGAIVLESGGAVCCTGYIRGVSSSTSTLIPNADLIILSLNGPSMEPLFLELAPYLRSDQAIVLLPAMGAVNYQQLKVAMRDAALRKDPTATAVHMPTYAATRTLPWACRVISPGRINLCGTKAGVPMCLAPGDTAEEAEAMSALLDSLFLGTSFQLNPNPIEQSFLPFDTLGNPVLHPGIMYGSWSEWDGQTYAQKRVFYHDVSEETVKVVESLQDEAKAVIAAYSSHLGLEKPPDITDLHADLYQCYSERIADPSTLYSLLRTNGAYEGIFHPMKQTEAGFVPDFSSRLLSEDVPCGLVAIRGVAQILGLETPWIDKVITWGQSKLGKEYLVDGKLIGKDINGTNCPQRFGIHSADELLITSQGAVAPHDHVHAEARPAQTLLRTLRTLPRISQSEK